MVQLVLRSAKSQAPKIDLKSSKELIALPILGKEIQINVDIQILRNRSYFEHFFKTASWQETESGPYVLEFPSLKMMDGFWIALQCMLGEPISALMKQVNIGNCNQSLVASCMLQEQNLTNNLCEYVITHMRPSLFLKAFQLCEKFHLLDFKQGLFRYILSTDDVVEHHAGLATDSFFEIDRSGQKIYYQKKGIALGQFYDVLQNEIKSKRSYFQPVKSFQSCYVQRIRNVAETMREHFILRDEQTDNILLAATHVTGSNDFVFSSTYPCVFGPSSANYLGSLEPNFVGTLFTMYDHGIPFNKPIARGFPDYIRGEHGAILYDNNILGRVPNAMTVIVPDIRLPPQESTLGLVDRFEAGKTNGLIILRTRQPRWNETVQSYTLDFGGRVKRASKKNFLIQENDNGDWLMLFGKVSKNRFSLDFRYPLSPMQVLSVALSSFADKLMVS